MSIAHPVPRHNRTVTMPVFTPKLITAELVPQNPFLAPNGRSNMHNDAYMSDAYTWAGPNGGTMEFTFGPLLGECATLTFNSMGRIVGGYAGLSMDGQLIRALLLLDPDTLEVMASYKLPVSDESGAGGGSTGFGAGGYFYLNNHDQAVVTTATQTLQIVDVINDPPSFKLARSFDLAATIGDWKASLQSAIPDWSGRIWWVTDTGVVGYTDPHSGITRKMRLSSDREISFTDPATGKTYTNTMTPAPEQIGNSFAVDETGGVFIASNYAMYRFDVAVTGDAPTITWCYSYDRGLSQKPGEENYGTGTTPTLIGSKAGSSYCGITDNAFPMMHVVVYHRDKDYAGDRIVCEVPVFPPGFSDTENSLIGYTGNFFVENNFGYTGSATTDAGTVTPGLARVRFDNTPYPGRKVWENDRVAVPSVVSKLSLANGLLYTYTLENSDGLEDWYITAVDAETGEVAWKVFAGTGQSYDNHYSALCIGPDGTVYVPVLSGILALRQA